MEGSWLLRFLHGSWSQEANREEMGYDGVGVGVGGALETTHSGVLGTLLRERELLEAVKGLIVVSDCPHMRIYDV